MNIPKNIKLIIESNYMLRNQNIGEELKDIQDRVIVEFEKLKKKFDIPEMEIVCIDSFNKSSIVITDMENEKRYLIFDLYLIEILDIFEASSYNIINITIPGIVPLLFIDEMMIRKDYNVAYVCAKILEQQVEFDRQWLPQRFDHYKEFDMYSQEEKKIIEEGYWEYAVKKFSLYISTEISFVLLHEIAHFFYEKGEVEIKKIKKQVTEIYNIVVEFEEVSHLAKFNVDNQIKSKWKSIIEMIDENQNIYFSRKFVETLENKEERELFIQSLIMYCANLKESSVYTMSDKKKYIRECTCDLYACIQLIDQYSIKKYYEKSIENIMINVMTYIGYMAFIDCIRYVAEEDNITENKFEKICDEMIERLNIVGYALRERMPDLKYLLEDARNHFWDEFEVYYNKFRESYYCLITYKNEISSSNNEKKMTDEMLLEQIMTILRRCGV